MLCSEPGSKGMNELEWNPHCSEIHWLFPQHLVPQALGRVGRATAADGPTLPGPAPQALGFRKPQPVLNSLKGGGWKGRGALPACSHHQKQSQY